MALRIRGKTSCPLCELVIHESDPVVCFPAFVSNELDPLYLFNDASFHHECFANHPLAEEAGSRNEAISERTSPENRKCTACGQLITEPDDYFCVYHLTDSPADALFQFNYLQLHRSCMADWPLKNELESLLNELNSSGRWKGPALSYLLQQLHA